MRIASVRSRVTAEGVASGYAYGCAVGFPLLTVGMLIWAANGHAHPGLISAAVGLLGTCLSWLLVRTFRKRG